jgi:hypothetical protein
MVEIVPQVHIFIRVLNTLGLFVFILFKHLFQYDFNLEKKNRKFWKKIFM